MTPATAAAAPRFLEVRNVETRVYSDGFSETAAIVKADRVFTDYRRMGFFRVRLLPVLVAQGVQLELTQSQPNTNWSASLHAKLAPFARNSPIEWRDVSVRLTNDPAPRLQAGQLRPGGESGAGFYVLENVTLQTDAGRLSVPRAKLLLTGPPGRVVWQSEGATLQWDLFTSKLIREKTSVNQLGNP